MWWEAKLDNYRDSTQMIFFFIMCKGHGYIFTLSSYAINIVLHNTIVGLILYCRCMSFWDNLQ